MNIIKTVLGVALLSTIIAPGVRASEEERAHRELVSTLESVGITVSINDPICQERDANGMYVSRNKLLVVCQDDGVPGGPLVGWTANDLDTLRHEAQHFIQDCVAGDTGDDALAPVYRSPSALAQEHLGSKRVAAITKTYRARGASDLTLLLEYEAFAVAALNIPLDQISDMKTYCGA